MKKHRLLNEVFSGYHVRNVIQNQTNVDASYHRERILQI